MVELYFYSPYILMVLCLIKHRNNFTLPLTSCFSTPVSVLKTLKFTDSRSDEVNAFFSIYLILPAALDAVVYSASSRNEYQNHKMNVSGE
jgi:hypothetical protein